MTSDKPLENWPQCPYPKDIFPMNTEEYVHVIPDLALRTAVSGHMARFGWEVAERQFLALFEEYKANLENSKAIS